MYKKLDQKQIEAIEAEVKLMLHASRDCLRNQKENTSKIKYLIYDAYYSEAFGVMRALVALGHGSMSGESKVNDHYFNLNLWFQRLKEQVLEEESFHGNQECDFCVEHYGKDGAGRIRKEQN